MHNLFERQHSLNDPVECFVFDASKEVFPVKPHWHYFAEFIFMLKGRAEVTSEERSFILDEGAFIVLHPSAVHSILPVDKELPVYAVFKFDLLKFPSQTSYAPSPVDIFRYARSEGMQVHFEPEQAERMKCSEIFNDCINEVKGLKYGADIMMRSQIYRLIFGIVREWIDAGLDIDSCPSSAGSSFGIENITEYIDAHLEDNIKVSDIAEECHLSYSGFATRFRELYGMSCKEYIGRMRIFKAEEYLMFTDHDLNYISSHTGFSDCSHFIRCFRQYRGITPKQFRLQRKNGNV